MRYLVVLFTLIAVAMPAGARSALAGKAALKPEDAPLSQPSTVSVLSVPSEKMRDALLDIYRPAPDRRFLSALSEMDSFLSGKEPCRAGATFIDGNWRIECGGKSVGTLPEVPDFSDFMKLLESRAKSLEAPYPLKCGTALDGSELKEIGKELDSFLSPELLGALHKIDGLWKEGGPQPELIPPAARALVFLYLQSLDQLGTGDQLPAKAVAVLAVAKTFSADKCLREECLLSYTMGYSVHAVELAKSLPESDPLRSYVMHDDKRLKDTASGENGSVESRYLYLLRISARTDREIDSIKAWMNLYFKDSLLSLPIMKVWMDIRGFSMVPHLFEVVPRLVLSDIFSDRDILAASKADSSGEKNEGYSEKNMLLVMRVIDSALKLDTPGMAARFEAGLKTASAKCNGPFLDSRSYQTFYSGYFFSSFYEAGLHYLDALSSIDAAKEFASLLPEAGSGLVADLRRWYLDLIASKEGKATPALIQADLEGLKELGLPPIMRIFVEYGAYAGYGQPDRLKAARALISRLDTRADYLERLYSMAYSHLVDLKLAEKTAQSILALDAPRHPGLNAACAHLRGDNKLLEELLNKEDSGCSTKLQILGYLQKQPDASPELITEEYRKLLSQYPDEWKVASQSSKYMEQIGKYEDERSIVNGWLERKVSTLGLERIYARTALARSYYREGRYEEGFKVIAPEIRSEQAGAMLIGAKLIEKLGRKDESEKLARAIVARYPDGIDYRAYLAKLYWSHGKYQEAGEVLKAGGKLVKTDDWQFKIAPEFTEAFYKRPKQDALNAFSALMAQGFSHFDLLRLTFTLSKKGENELAFDMSSQLKGNGFEYLEYLVCSYRYLKECKGKPYALDWLREKIPPPMLDPLSMVAYSDKEYDLVWDPIGDPGKGKTADFVWLLRAAASLKVGPGNDPHRDALLTHYKMEAESSADSSSSGLLSRLMTYVGLRKENSGSQSSGSYYEKLGRFLCGQIPEQEILKLATEPNKRCEIAYYIGLKAQAEGRYADACDWYRVAQETGLIRMGEYRWAYNTLYAWLGQNKSLSRLESERL